MRRPAILDAQQRLLLEAVELVDYIAERLL